MQTCPSVPEQKSDPVSNALQTGFETASGHSLRVEEGNEAATNLTSLTQCDQMLGWKVAHFPQKLPKK